ncbi:MAG: hypothetical protein QF642_16410 [Myxococcota bacterium]|nr:hypothetical protein [Myxococcota bacterium]
MQTPGVLRDTGRLSHQGQRHVALDREAPLGIGPHRESGVPEQRAERRPNRLRFAVERPPEIAHAGLDHGDQVLDGRQRKRLRPCLLEQFGLLRTESLDLSRREIESARPHAEVDGALEFDLDLAEPVPNRLRVPVCATPLDLFDGTRHHVGNVLWHQDLISDCPKDPALEGAAVDQEPAVADLPPTVTAPRATVSLASVERVEASTALAALEEARERVPGVRPATSPRLRHLRRS